MTCIFILHVYRFIAFDPIFFLHHCNVDRLYAFWAFVYPDAWMDKGYTAIVNDEEVEGYKFGTYPISYPIAVLMPN